MFNSNKKPFTAVTVQIENLTSEQYDEHDFSGIVDLIEVIRLQSSGPTEAARAIRKKLKYGSVHRQLRALTILDGLIQNAGPRFQRVFADEPLLERLRFCATDSVTDEEVKEKCKMLFRQWSASYRNTPGMEQVASLYQQLPQRKKQQTRQQSKVVKDTEAEANADDETSGPSSATSPTSSSRPRAFSTSGSKQCKKDRDKKSSRNAPQKVFNLERERPQLLQTLAASSVASTNLMNALKLTNRENKRVSEDPEVVKRFEECKLLRRQILRYIQHVESEQWLGGLIHANEELVAALMAYEVLDKSVDVDSDSEDEWDNGGARDENVRHRLGSLSLGDAAGAPPKPPRPVMSIGRPQAGVAAYDGAGGKGMGMGGGSTDDEDDSEDEDEEEEEEDENDPFADRNAVDIPPVDRPGMIWSVPSSALEKNR